MDENHALSAVKNLIETSRSTAKKGIEMPPNT